MPRPRTAEWLERATAAKERFERIKISWVKEIQREVRDKIEAEDQEQRERWRQREREWDIARAKGDEQEDKKPASKRNKEDEQEDEQEDKKPASKRNKEDEQEDKKPASKRNKEEKKRASKKFKRA